MRCDDCLDDLPARHFVIVEPDDTDPDFAEFDEKHVCAECVDWYRDPIGVTA
jgi:hypothetical protein